MIELKSAICPECGGRLVIDPLSPSSGKCKSCGFITLITGVPGFSDEKAAWINAVHQMEDGDTDKADNYFRQIIEKKPDYGEAYFGRFECAITTAKYYRKLNYSLRRCIPDYLDALNEAITKFGRRAIEYAPDEETKQIYEKRVQEIESEIDSILNPPSSPKRGFFSKLFG